jgi:hypothetical protein
MTTRARLRETVEQYRVRQEGAAEGGATFRSDRGDDARKLLALVGAASEAVAAFDVIEGWALGVQLMGVDLKGDRGSADAKRIATFEQRMEPLRAALLSITLTPEARDG